MEFAKLDGRRARWVRTHDAIVSAVFELVPADTTAPTAQQIADQAGVSVRSVYHHFTDAEGLYADVSGRMNEKVVSLRAPIDPSLPLGQRINEYVSERASTLEVVTPFSRMSKMAEPTSETLRTSSETFQRESRARLSQVFSNELDTVDDATRRLILDALEVTTSWTSWDYMRIRGHSAGASRAILRTMVSSLLDEHAA